MTLAVHTAPKPASPSQGELLQTLDREFEGTSAKKAPCVLEYGLATFGLQLQLADGPRHRRLFAALRHLGPASPDTPLLRIKVWSGQRPRMLEQAIASLGDRKQLSILGPHLHMSVELEGRAISVYDKLRQRGYFWCEEPDRLPGYLIANPLRLLLHWWLRSNSLQFIHAAAVGHDGKAALIVGNSGVGKSTTALSCVEAGLDYIADDYCICRTAPTPHVYSVYQSAKIEQTNLSARLPGWRSHLINPTENDKAVVFVDEVLPNQLRRQARLVAMLLPRFGPTTTDRLRPASKMEALRAIAPSSLIQMPGQGSGDLRALRSLVDHLPAYQLHLSPQLDHNSEVIGDLLERL